MKPGRSTARACTANRDLVPASQWFPSVSWGTVPNAPSLKGVAPPKGEKGCEGARGLSWDPAWAQLQLHQTLSSASVSGTSRDDTEPGTKNQTHTFDLNENPAQQPYLSLRTEKTKLSYWVSCLRSHSQWVTRNPGPLCPSVSTLG